MNYMQHDYCDKITMFKLIRFQFHVSEILLNLLYVLFFHVSGRICSLRLGYGDIRDVYANSFTVAIFRPTSQTFRPRSIIYPAK